MAVPAVFTVDISAYLIIVLSVLQLHRYLILFNYEVKAYRIAFRDTNNPTIPIASTKAVSHTNSNNLILTSVE